MPDLSRFRALSKRERAIVAVAVLLDAGDSVAYLSADIERRTALQRAAEDITSLPADLRIPLVATLLRENVLEVSRSPFITNLSDTGKISRSFPTLDGDA